MKATTKYDVKNEYGQLTFQSLEELKVLYQREFVSDDDLVSRHGSERWTPAGRMPELAGSREQVADKSTPVWSAVLLVFLVFGLLLARRYHSSLWVIFLAVTFLAVAIATYWQYRYGSGGWARATHLVFGARRSARADASSIPSLAGDGRTAAVSPPPDPRAPHGPSQD